MASLYESGCKRLVDLALSLLLLLLLAPFLSLIAGILLCTEGRPVFFCQKRPGRGEKPFLLIKFRTMRPAPPGAPEALPDAGRVTPLGAFLRRTSIDELPELWNVLRGDMSLVGPRPLLMRYLPYFRPAERVRFRFRPGITGLAQVQGRNNAAWDQRLAADIQYAETFGFLQDVRILAKTFIQVVLGRDVQVAPSTAMLDLDQERAVMQPAKDASREQGGGARVPARSQATESPGFHVVDAVASDAAAIVQLIQGGFEPRLLAGLVYGYPGIRFFVADQIGLGALSPYRYKVIRGPDGLLAAAEFRILEDALFLNYVAVVPDHFRKGLAMAVIADMRQEAAGQGLARFVLDVFTHNRIAINWYANKLKMAPGEVTTAWMASLPALDLPTPYRISDFPQAESVHQRLGFSEFTLAGGPSPLRIGRLGDRFFRLVQPGAASDPAVLSVLSRLDPARRLLVIAPGSHPAGPGWELLYSTQRFQVGIQEYIHA